MRRLLNSDANRLKIHVNTHAARTSLAAQWLRLCPSNAGDAGLIPGRGTKIPHAAEELSPRATTTEPVCSGALEPTQHNYRSLHNTRKSSCAATKTRRSQVNK